jgi:phosphate transport system substrate-binding protein
MHRAPVPLACLLLAVCLLCGCRQRGERAVDNLVLSGSHGMVPLVSDIAERFMQHHPAVRVNVDSAPGDRGITDTRSGLADLGLLGRALRTDETGLLAFPIARDGVAILVHRSNPVQRLTEAQIVGLFTRTYLTWAEVGGPADRPVSIAGQGEGRAARGAFLQFFGLRKEQVRAEPTEGGDAAVIAAVAAHPFAIGFASLGLAEKAAETMPIRLLPLGGVPATLDNVRIGRYPLVRPLQLLAREPPAGAVRDFLQFARSAEVRDLVERHHLAPVTP